jgi:hypothetical protein
MLTLLLSLLASSSAHALPVHETYIVQDYADESRLSHWSALPGSRSYVFQYRAPGSDQLEPLTRLRGADQVEIEVSTYPGEDSIDAWTKLARSGVTLVGLDAGIPTDDEIARLNRAGISRYIFVLTYAPGPEEAARIGKLHGSISLTMALTAYPKFEDRPGLIAVPAGVPMLFSTDYWPFYTHMDLFNTLPNSIRLRVSDMFPPSDELTYLTHIQRLRDVTVETLGGDAPDTDSWTNFGGIPVRWSSKDFIPSADGIAAIERSASLGRRSITIDSDYPLSDDERGRLEASSLPVEWIHAAPDSYLTPR